MVGRLADRLIVGIDRWYSRRRRLAYVRATGRVPEQAVFVETPPINNTRTYQIAKDAAGRMLRVHA